MTLKNILTILVAVLLGSAAGVFLANQQDTSPTETFSNVGFKKDFAKARKSLEQCNFQEAKDALDSQLTNAHQLGANVRWKDGISRWVYFHDYAVATYLSGNKQQAVRFAKQSAGLYDKLALSDAVQNIHTPPGAPNFDQMLDDLRNMIDGLPPSSRC